MPERLTQDTAEWLTIGQAAERRGISVSTLLRWEKAGHVRPTRTLGGHRRYRAEEIDKLLDTEPEGRAAENSGQHTVSPAPTLQGEPGSRERLDRPAAPSTSRGVA